MGRRAVGVGIAVGLLAGSARGEEPRRGSVAVETRVAEGISSVDDVTLGLAGVAGEWRLAPTLAVRGALLGLVARGRAYGGEPAPWGGGGELALRVRPWPAWRVRPVLGFAAGLLGFPEDFLRGGSRYDFMLTYGGGVEVSLTPRWHLAAELGYVHLSNGQGLGPHNPAFDGAVVGVSLAVSAAPVDAFAAPAADDPRAGGRAQLWPGVLTELGYGRVDDSVLTSARVQLAQRLGDHWLALVDGWGGTLGEPRYGEVGVGVAMHHRAASAGARVAHRAYAGIRVPSVALQGEWHVTPVASLVATATWERPQGFDEAWRGGVGLRALPLDGVVIDLGVGFDKRRVDGFIDISDPYYGLEWQLPWGASGWPIALFVERQVDQIRLVGLRVGAGVGDTRRDVVRHDGFRWIR